MKINIKKCSARILVMSLFLSIISPTNISFAADQSNVIVHYNMTHANGKLTDVTGNGHDATMVNVNDSDFTTGSAGTALNFDATAKYAKIPAGIIQGETFTIESTFKAATNANHWLWTLGTTAASWPNVKNYLFVNPLSAQGGYVGKVLGGIKDANTELRSDPLTPNTTELNTVVAVFNNGALTIYLNGIATPTLNTGYSIQSLLAANSTADCIGYIGRSLYSPDPYYKGSLYDFKVYNTALTGSEIKSNYDANQAIYLQLAKENLTVSGIDNVYGNLTLPTSGSYNSQITWASSDASVITSTGVVTKPAVDTTVTLTATITLGSTSVQKVFTANVKSDASILNSAKENLIVNNIDDVCGNLTLPITGQNNTNITWTSGNPGIITDTASGDTPAGVVTRPSSDTTVTLTATLTLGSSSVQKVFTAKVKAKPGAITTDKYMFAYFIGQNGPTEEQLYFAGSADGLNWNELNGGKPVLSTTMGEKGVRDPFIMRSPEGDKFYLIATDLSIYYNGDWGRAQTAGSQSIMIWESADLVHWSNQRMVKIARDDAGCTWAPEAFYDKNTGEYIVFWASKVGTDNYAKQRVYYCKTRDFYTFTEPQVWLEESYSVIDCTVIKDDVTGYYYRFTKNESSTYIYLERSTSLMTPFEKVASWKNVTGAEGPTCYNLNGTNEWLLLVDYFGAGGYSPYSIKDLSNPAYTKPAAGTYSLPSNPRHGTVMNITSEEYKNIMSAYGELTGDLSSVPDVVMQGDGASVFPATINLGIPGFVETQKTYDINWNITKDTFAKVGLVTVTGTVTSMPSKTISKEVLVVRRNTKYFVHSATDITNQQSPYYNSLASKTTLLNSKSDQAYDGKWGHTAYDGSMGTSSIGINNSGFYGKNDGSVNPTYKVTLNSGKYTLDSMQYEWWTGPRTIEVHALYTDSNGKAQDVILGNSTVKASSRIGMTSGEFTIDKDNTEVTIIFKRASGDGGVVSYFAIAESSIVTAVDAIADMNVANGTVKESIGLPASVNISIDGLSTTSAAVTWDNGNPSYNGSIAGDYNFTGALVLANGIKNPNNLKTTVKVRVREENEVPATAPASVELTRDDDTLTAILKNADGSNFTTDAAVKYDWYRDSELVEEENNKNYNLSDIDKGTSIKVEVSQYGLISNIIDISNNSSPADGVIKPIKVRIEGTEKVGKTLEAQLLAINGVEFTTSSAVTYEWHRLSSEDSEDGILVGNDKTYKLVGKDKGNYIKLIATYDGETFEDITLKIERKSSSSSSSSSESSSSNSSASNTGNSENSNSSNNESAAINDGWKNNSDNTLKYIKNGQPTTGWNQIEGSWYLMDSTGTVQNGWKQADGIWYLLKNNGAMATGWQQTNDNWYFLKDSGAMAIGWIQSDGAWYFLKDNGAMATGWQKSNGQWYYLYSNGSMASNTVIDNYRLAENGAWIN